MIDFKSFVFFQLLFLSPIWPCCAQHWQINQHLAELFCFSRVFWAWQRKHDMGRGNGEQAQQVTATHKAAAWIEAAGRKQENLRNLSYLQEAGRRRRHLLPISLPGRWWRSCRSWTQITKNSLGVGHQLKSVKAQASAEDGTIIWLQIIQQGIWEEWAFHSHTNLIALYF